MYQRGDSSSRSEWVFCVYLNDDFEDGQTVFHKCSILDRRVAVKPKTGMAVIFQMQDLLHQGFAPRDGTKYFMQSSILFEPFPEGMSVKQPQDFRWNPEWVKKGEVALGGMNKGGMGTKKKFVPTLRSLDESLSKISLTDVATGRKPETGLAIGTPPNFGGVKPASDEIQDEMDLKMYGNGCYVNRDGLKV